MSEIINRKTLKNTGWMFAAQIITKVFSLLLVVYLGRTLLLEDFGRFNLANAFVSIVVVFVDFGFNIYVVREIAKNKGRAGLLLGSILPAKILFAAIVLISTFVVPVIMDYGYTTRIAVFILGLFYVLLSFSAFFRTVFIGYELMEFESIFSILDRFLILSGVFIVLFFGGTFIGAVTVYPAVESVILAASVVVLLKKAKDIRIKFSREILTASLKESTPFFLANILMMVFLYVDSVMLSKMKDETAVGLYNASYNLIYNLRILVSPFVIALFPAMSLHAVSNKEKLAEMYYRVKKSIILLGLAVTVLGFALSKPIILLLYGDKFRDSIPAFSILILAIPAIYLSGYFGYLLTSLNYQKEILKYLFIACVINVVLNAVFIPAYSFIGASVITVISEIILVSLCYMKLYKLGFK